MSAHPWAVACPDEKVPFMEPSAPSVFIHHPLSPTHMSGRSLSHLELCLDIRMRMLLRRKEGGLLVPENPDLPLMDLVPAFAVWHGEGEMRGTFISNKQSVPVCRRLQEKPQLSSDSVFLILLLESDCALHMASQQTCNGLPALKL